MTDIKDASTEAAHQANQELGQTAEGKKILGNADLGAKILDRYEESVRDALTGSYNRRFLDREINLLLSLDKSFALVIVDIDHFKRINDQYGHNTGDAVLRHLVVELSNGIKTARPEGQEDVLARFGGEEFAIILRGVSDRKVAESIAERARKRIEQAAFATQEGTKLNITISAGVTVRDKSDNLESLTKRADLSLYEAKENGRNKVVSK